MTVLNDKMMMTLDNYSGLHFIFTGKKDRKERRKKRKRKGEKKKKS